MLAKDLQNYTNLQHHFLHMGSTPPPFSTMCKKTSNLVADGFPYLVLYQSDCCDNEALDSVKRQTGADQKLHSVAQGAHVGASVTSIDVGSLQLVALSCVGCLVREAPRKDTACSNGILPNSISTHPPSSKRTLCGRYFSPKISKFFKTAILTLGMDILTITMVKHDS